ncbi:MAG TPA: ribonuclease HII [Steroidobacteraceae bacterium]|nr:ribonuclease HII [Steroidobacteraceae bacterium]
MTGRGLRIAGVDEAGRGPLAGPVYAAAVILDPGSPIEGLADSKQLTPGRRAQLVPLICERALAWHIAWSDVEEIDCLNILGATLLAMRRAVCGLALRPALVQVDGNRLPSLADLCDRAEPVVGGDASIPAISAASILAKHARDALMAQLDAAYPGYQLHLHKGYATSFHMEALSRLGPSPQHRHSFAPVREAMIPSGR